MLIKNAPLPKTGANKLGCAYRRAKFEIPFDQMDKDDAFRVDLESPECDMTHNLIRQRCFRASTGGRLGKQFVTRKSGSIIMIHRVQ